MQNKLLYSELTKGSSFILAFFFLALFSFQDAVFVVFLRFLLSFQVPFSSGDLFIIPHFRMFVKPFFKLFSKVFLDFRLLKRFAFIPSSSLSPDRLVWISLASHFFAKLYPLRLFSFPKLRRFLSVSFITLALQLYYYNTIPSICQAEETKLICIIFVHFYHPYFLD